MSYTAENHIACITVNKEKSLVTCPAHENERHNQKN